MYEKMHQNKLLIFNYENCMHIAIIIFLSYFFMWFIFVRGKAHSWWHCGGILWKVTNLHSQIGHSWTLFLLFVVVQGDDMDFFCAACKGRKTWKNHHRWRRLPLGMFSLFLFLLLLSSIFSFFFVYFPNLSACNI